MILLRFLISLLLISLIMILTSCGSDVETDQGKFTYAINYYSQADEGDSVFIAGTKSEPGIKSPGWALYQSFNGAWGFSIGDGSSGFIYQPTPERQSLTDGKKHGLAFALDTVKMEIRWWFDGKNVAIYNVTGLDFSKIDLGEPTGFKDPIVFYPKTPVTDLKVMAWNIWHGGRESGLTEGVARVVDVIKQSQADIICMVETYGSGPIIADSLGYYFYLRSSNLSIMSRFPIGETADMFRAFNYGGAEVWLSPKKKLMVHPLWIHYLPDMNNLKDSTIPVDSLLKWEWQTRGTEIKEILTEMKNELTQSDQAPVIMAGDYNSASHLDWDSSYADLHQGRVIEWPVSKQMIDAGMTDAYRRIHPNSRSHPGHTWSPIFHEAWQDRIDYIYYKGNKLEPTAAEVISSYTDIFPSDHAAVVVTFQWIAQ